MGKQRTTTVRYTTSEVAVRLRLDAMSTTRLLRALGVEFSRCGSAYLWDALTVDELLNSLRNRKAKLTEDGRTG